MKYILFYVFFTFLQCVKGITVLKLNECKDIKHGPMEFKLCKDLTEYKKYYFEDATGINQITFINDRLYRNHNYYTAYSNKEQIYIGKKLYKKKEWFKFRESYFK